MTSSTAESDTNVDLCWFLVPCSFAWSTEAPIGLLLHSCTADFDALKAPHSLRLSDWPRGNTVPVCCRSVAQRALIMSVFVVEAIFEGRKWLGGPFPLLQNQGNKPGARG